jgi:hypothetical protein
MRNSKYLKGSERLLVAAGDISRNLAVQGVWWEIPRSLRVRGDV